MVLDRAGNTSKETNLQFSHHESLLRDFIFASDPEAGGRQDSP